MFKISEIPDDIRERIQEGEVIVNPVEQIKRDLGNGWNLIASQKYTYENNFWADLLVNRVKSCIITDGFTTVQFMRKSIEAHYTDGDRESWNSGWTLKYSDIEENDFSCKGPLTHETSPTYEYIAARNPLIMEYAKQSGVPEDFLDVILGAVNGLSD